MNSLSFILGLLCLISIDVILCIIIFVVYRYVDFKYFSSLEINQLKEENKFLKEENKKFNGTNASFWSNE